MNWERIACPLATAENEIAVALASLGTLVSGNAATYVAVPMTSGKRFIQWFANDGRLLDSSSSQYRESFVLNVLEPNICYANLRIVELRRQAPVLIDPTRLNIPEWSQGDYRVFWGRVMEKYVKTAVFLDGWEYSAGCSYEFLVATGCKAQALREDQSPLSIRNGKECLRIAIKEMECLNVDASIQTAVLDCLNSK